MLIHVLICFIFSFFCFFLFFFSVSDREASLKERERLLEENERAIELHQMNLALFAEQQQQQHQQMQLQQQQQPHRYPATPAPGTYNWSPSMRAMLAVPPPPPTPFFPQGGQNLYQYHIHQAQQQQLRHGLHTPLGSPQLPGPLKSYIGTSTTPKRPSETADLAAECRRYVPTPAALSAVGNVYILLLMFHYKNV